MSEPSLVDLVGVGLNATDTLISLPTLSRARLQGRVLSALNSSRRTDGFGGDRLPDLGTDARATSASWAMTMRRAASPRVCAGGRGRAHCDGARMRRARSRSLWWTAAASARCCAGAMSGCCCSRKICDREWIVNARALHVDGLETAAATQAASWARARGHSGDRRSRRALYRR